MIINMYILTKTDLACFYESFRNFTIATAITSSDKISHTTTFKESRKFSSREKDIHELNHFHKT